MSLGFGTRLGPYEIVSAIGATGMGEVYRARVDRTVAIKVLPSAVSNDPAPRERFEREARTSELGSRRGAVGQVRDDHLEPA